MLQPTAKITIAATHVVDSPSFLSNSCRKINSNKYKFDTLFKHLQGFHIKYIWNAHIGKLYGLLSHKAKTLELPAFFIFIFIFDCSTSGKGGFEPSLALLKTWPGNSIVTSLLFILLYYIYIYIYKGSSLYLLKNCLSNFPKFQSKKQSGWGEGGP